MSEENQKEFNPELDMKTYTGTKTLKGFLTTKGWYNQYQGWQIPEDQDPDEEVYLVEYPVEEDTVPNHKNHVGYISMSPKTVFEKYYTEDDGTTPEVENGQEENESEQPTTWKERLKNERNELSENIEKLDVAINTKKVPKEEVEILTRQVYSMRKYRQILDERLGRLK